MIQHLDLTTQIYQWLKGRILDRTFRPGDKLDIQKIADDLGVSRTPVKDAINRLNAEGLIVLHSRRGTYVAELSPRVLHELFEVRRMIECWAAEQLTPVTMANAHQHVLDLFTQGEHLIQVEAVSQFDYNAFFVLDTRLHGLIVALPENSTLTDLHHGIMTRMYAGRLYFASKDEEYRRSVDAHAEHRVIVGAFGDCNPQALSRALDEHIRASERSTAWLVDRVTPSD